MKSWTAAHDLSLSRTWYEAPCFSFASPTALVGHEAPIHRPQQCDELDYGLQIAAIIGREFAVTALRSLAFSRGLIIPASPLGKVKMVAQVVAILLLILGWERYPPLALLGKAALWVVLTAALVSAIDYYRKFQRALGAASEVTDFAAAKARLEERKRIS